MRMQKEHNAGTIRFGLPKKIDIDERIAIDHGITAAWVYAIFKHYTDEQDKKGQLLPGSMTSLDSDHNIWLRFSSGELSLLFGDKPGKILAALKRLRESGYLRADKRGNESDFDHTIWHACEYQFEAGEK